MFDALESKFKNTDQVFVFYSISFYITLFHSSEYYLACYEASYNTVC